TGGNNAQRTLVVQGPSTNISLAVKDAFTLPTDVADKRMMVEVHFYDPWSFAGQEDDGAAWFWGKGNTGSSHNATYNSDEDFVKPLMESLNNKFYANGVPVILGEYGAQWRSIGDEQAIHDSSVKAWFKEVTAQSINNGIIPMAWDINNANNSGTKGTMTIINRANLSIFCQPAFDGITEGVKSSTWK
ncbi:MAG: cellulase family glycosylhydrolase, partial [Prevotella sp.]